MNYKQLYNELSPGKQRKLRAAFTTWFKSHTRSFYRAINKPQETLKPCEIDFFNNQFKTLTNHGIKTN